MPEYSAYNEKHFQEISHREICVYCIAKDILQTASENITIKQNI